MRGYRRLSDYMECFFYFLFWESFQGRCFKAFILICIESEPCAVMRVVVGFVAIVVCEYRVVCSGYNFKFFFGLRYIYLYYIFILRKYLRKEI